MNRYHLCKDGRAGWYKSTDVDKLITELQLASIESISERCSRTHVQCCNICEDMSCGDNTSVAKRRIIELEKLIKELS